MINRSQLLEAGLTNSVIGSFFEVHRELGFGYRAYIYALALERDLAAKGHRVDREVGVMVYFRGEPLARQTLDMIVDEKLVIEIKATERLPSNTTLQLFVLQRAYRAVARSTIRAMSASYSKPCCLAARENSLSRSK